MTIFIMVFVSESMVTALAVAILVPQHKWYDPGKLNSQRSHKHHHKDDDSKDQAPLVELAGCFGSFQCSGLVTPLNSTAHLQKQVYRAEIMALQKAVQTLYDIIMIQ